MRSCHLPVAPVRPLLSVAPFDVVQSDDMGGHIPVIEDAQELITERIGVGVRGRVDRSCELAPTLHFAS